MSLLRKRVIATLLSILVTFNMLSQTVFALRVSTTENNGWQLSSSLSDRISMSKSDAYTWVTGELTRIAAELTSALDSTSQPNTSKVLSLYGAYLAYMNWAVSNVSVYTDTQQWTVFQGPADFDTTTAAGLIDGAEQFRNRINELGLLPSSTSVADKTYNSSSATSYSLEPSSKLLSSGDEIYAYSGYWDAMQSLITEYVDGHVLVIVANYFERSGTSKAALQNSLSSSFPTDWWNSTQEGSPPAEMVTVITDLKSELLPYLDIYNEIVAANSAATNRVLKDETLEAGSVAWDVTAYTYPRGDNNSLESEVSYITRALYTYLYSAQTGGSQSDNQVLEDIDVSGDALKILANVTVNEKGEIKPASEERELTTLGYYILAAGATYDPFVSIAGNETYFEVLKRFFKNSDQQDKVIRVLQTAVNTRKPIYVTDATRGEWASEEDVTEIPSAEYRIARLSDMLAIGENTAKAYAVITGKMRPSAVDSSTWEYVHGGSSSSSTNTSTSGNTTVEVVSDTELVTVGTEELLAPGTVMSLPVAYTCGSNSLVTSGRTSAGIVQTVGGLTSVILNNAALDNKGDIHLERKESEMLFLNGLGDIVLSDGTVVLPAVANPILYDYSTTSVMSPDELDNTSGYYPYTATFLNHYPSMRVSPDSKTYVSGDNSIGKYVLSFSDDGVYEAVKIYGVKASEQMQTGVTDRVRVALLGLNSLSMESDVTAVRQLLNYYESETGNFRTFFFTGVLGAWVPNIEYLVYTPKQTGDGISIFPLQYDSADMQESYLNLAAPIITSTVRYISTADSSADNVRTTSGKFRVKSYIEDFAAQGMLGNQYSETMVKNYQLDYETLVNEQYSRFTRLIRDMASETLDTLGRIDGVLAIKNGYESGFFNTIMNFIQRAYIIIAVVLLIVIAVKFLRGHYNLIYVFFIGCLVFSSFQVYAVWMPTAVPAAYNFFVNDIIEGVVWNTVAVKSESYETTYKDSSRVDAQTGEPRPYTATITLYKMTQSEMEKLAEQLGVSAETIKSGTAIYLDEAAGIFVQGDSIKMSIDKLLANNAMRGLYSSQWDQVDAGLTEEVDPITVQGNDNPYIVKLTYPYVSLESYYTPFCLFERAFLVNLNNFSNIFRIDRRTYRYDNYVYKDAFLFSSFTNSAIFTNPGDDTFETLKLNIRTDSILGDNTATVEDIIALCEQHMSPFEDWLNLRSVFSNPSASMRESLWGKMLQKQGYYSADWTMTPEQEEKVTNLISYINDQTKQFVIRNSDQLNFCSDENAIKLVSLYATTCFTHRVSEFGYWLYPNYINASDIELRDVLYGSMTTLSDRNTATETDVVNIVTMNLGMWGALLVLLITITSAIFIFVLTYLIPVLYGLFGIILVYKLINSEASVGAVKGYVKVTVVTVLLYMCYSFGLMLIGTLGYQWYGYLGCLLITVLCIYFLFFVCLSIVSNPLELGNDTLARNLFGALDRLTGGRLNRLSSNILHVNSQRGFTSIGMSHGARGYLRGTALDDRAPGRIVRRSEHYGRWSDFDDDSLSMRARVMSRFGQSAHLDDVGRTRTGFRHSRPLRTIRRIWDRVGSVTMTSLDGTGVQDRFNNFLHRR